MEYMKIEGFLGKSISKIINKSLANKVGFQPNIELKNLSFETDGSDELIKIQLTAMIKQKDFEQIVEEVTK